MSGFIPLIEAFIALGLTMLALTTGVSAIVGTIQRAARLRALGLRQMMTYFYANELEPELERLARDNAGFATSLEHPALERAQLLVDTTLAPLVVDGIRVTSVKGKGLRTEDVKKAIEARKPKGLDPRLVRIFANRPDREHGEGAVEIDLDNWTSWLSLRYSLDTVTIDEFKAKFAASTLGKKIQAHLPPDRFAAELDLLLDRYKAHGSAASERFGRRARWMSFVAAFALAILANVDSFNLLSIYLAQPDLRRQLITEYERTGKAELKTSDQIATESKLAKDVAAKQEELAKLAKELPDGEARKRVEAAAEALQTGSTVVTDIQATIISATQTFPIGWTLYPNCAPSSPDLRCAALRARPKGEVAWPECERLKPGAAAKPAEAARAADKGSSGEKSKTNEAATCNVLDYIPVVSTHDGAAFWRWVFGILVAGLMLGLGTPFWIETVNGLLRARSLMRGGSGDEGAAQPPARGGSATAGSAAAGSGTAPQGGAAAAPPAATQGIRATL